MGALAVHVFVAGSYTYNLFEKFCQPDIPPEM